MIRPAVLRSVFALAVFAFPLALAGCGDRSEDRIHASGHIEVTEVTLAATVGGRLLELPLEEGHRVRAGQIAARLETQDAVHQLARARAESAAAEARLALLLSGTRKEDLRRAEEQLAQAREEMEAARRDWQRLSALAESGTATRKSADDARTRREVAERQVAVLTAEVDKLVAGPRREEIDIARAQRAASEAAVAAADQRITDATVLVPRDGVITSRIAEPGEVLPPGAPLAVLADLDRPWLAVWIDERSLSRVAVGDTVEVRIGGQDRPFRGHVVHLAQVAEFTPKNVQTPEERAKLVFRVKVLLDNADGLFKPGMPADAYFTRRAAARSTES